MTRPLDSVDPLAGLYLPPPRGPVVPTRYRSGKVLAWNTSTGAHTIDVDGVQLSDLPMYPGEYIEQVIEGDNVSLLTTTDNRGLSTMIITGLPLRPGDPRLARVPLAERVQRVENVTGAGPQNTAEFELMLIPFAKFLPFSVYRVSAFVHMYGNTDAGTNIGNRSRLRLESPGAGGTQLWTTIIENSDNITGVNGTYLEWRVRNNTGSTVNKSYALVASAADSISIGMAGSSAEVNYLEFEYISDSVGKYPNAPQV